VYAWLEKNRSSLSYYDYTKEEVNYQGHGITKQLAGVDDVIEATRFMVMEAKTSGINKPSIGEVEELAHRGLDAKQILSSYYPKSTIGLTTSIPSKIIR